MIEMIVENKYGEKLNLTNNPDYITSQIYGLTPAAAVINRSESATKDGSTYNGGRLGERNITFNVYPRNNVERSRLNLYKFLNTNQYVKLYLKNGSREVWIDGHVETMDGDLYAEIQYVPVSIICTDPYFKAIETTAVSFSVVTNEFTFPFSISEEGQSFSTITHYTEKNILNSSTAEIGVVIEIYALDLALEPTIYNTTTGESFTLNHEFITGDVVRIDTRKGHKSITLLREGVETNILNQMARGSSWLKLLPGDNIFSYTAVHAPENLQVTVNLQPIFGGI